MLSKKELIYYYELMLFTRRFEQQAEKFYLQGKIRGFCHLYIGQEAITTALAAALQQQDSFITAYRCHAHCLISGMTPESVMAELLGKSTGCSRGKGGSMHMFNIAGNYYGGHGIVGAQVPIGTGIAFAEKYRNNNGVCVTFLGDGAINQGQVYESFNMASLWQLPVLYVVENNGYGMGTSVTRAAANTDLYNRGESFGIKGQKCNGDDFIAVYQLFKHSMDEIRKNNRPILIEISTYRYKGHSMSDPGKSYRTKEEVEQYKTSHDPVINLRNLIIKQYGVAEEEFKNIDKTIKQKVTKIAKTAELSPTIDNNELYTDVIEE